MKNQLIQEEILKNIDQNAIAFFGLPTIKDIIEDYVINLPANLKFIIANESHGCDILTDRSSEWADDVMGILSELDMQAADDAIMYEQCYAGNDN